MSTLRFEPTSAWQHALARPDCPHHLLLVAEDREQVVGWCRSFPECCDGLATEVELGIGLLPAYRERGIGTELVARSLAWAQAAGLRAVHLITEPDNTRAVRLFTGSGFAVNGQCSDGRLEMQCSLESASLTDPWRGREVNGR